MTETERNLLIAAAQTLDALMTIRVEDASGPMFACSPVLRSAMADFIAERRIADQTARHIQREAEIMNGGAVPSPDDDKFRKGN